MAQSKPRHLAVYRQDAGTGDGRLVAPTFLRNNPPMVAALAPYLAGRVGPALEIGAGSGQHACAFSMAFPGLDWHPSDPDEPHRTSIAAWATILGATVRPALDIDAASDWASRPEVQSIGPLQLVLSMNVIHISPPTVMHGIIAGAGQRLAPNGLLIFYGPFKENGKHTGEGNASFDAGLKAENPEWGLRDTVELDALATKAGLSRLAFITMPANNRVIIYRR